MKLSKGRKAAPPKAFAKKAKRMPPPDPMIAPAPAPLEDPMAAAPMFKRGGGVVSDMDMDDSPRAKKRADRKSKNC